MDTSDARSETRIVASIYPTGVLITLREYAGVASAGMLIALRVDAGLASASMLVALRVDAGLAPAGMLVALRVDAGVAPAGLLVTLRVDASMSHAGLLVASVALSARAGVTEGALRVTRTTRTRVRRERQSCGQSTLRAEPNVEVELVDRLRTPGQDIVDRCITPDRDSSRLVTGEGRPVGRNRLRVEYVPSQEFGIIVQLCRQVEALVARPVALTGQSGQNNTFLCRLRGFWLEALNEWMLPQFLARVRSIGPASATNFTRHSTPPSNTIPHTMLPGCRQKTKRSIAYHSGDAVSTLWNAVSIKTQSPSGLNQRSVSVFSVQQSQCKLRAHQA
jgi:hypothetical protein